MATEVFNRYENKFLIDRSLCGLIQDKLLTYMEPDEYNKTQDFYTISNIYYDTKDNYLIRNSLSKPEYKEKLRLRAYGVPKLDSKVYLEIKKKFCGLVNKRRTTLRLNEAYEFAGTGIKPELKSYMNKQVVNEIEYMLSLYDVEPKVYLAYDRTALFGRENRDLRITFDTNIRIRRYDLKLEYGDYGEVLLDSGQMLMEIKVENSIPVWLSQLLSEHRIYSASFSKYGRAHNKYLMNCKRAQYSILMYYPNSMQAGTLINLKDSNENTVLTFAPEKEYQSVVISSPELRKDSKYTLYSGGTSTGSESNGLYTDGVYDGGTKVVDFTVTSPVTWLSETGATTQKGASPGGGGRSGFGGKEF